MIKENIFDGKRLFTTTHPTDYTIKQVKANEFAVSTERFLNECFRGAIDLTVDRDVFGYVEVSVYGFAYLVKLVLSKIYGKRVANASLSFTSARVIFSIDFADGNEESDITDVIIAAESSGLISERTGNRLNFYAAVKQSNVLSLYARDGYYTFGVYNEVFFV